MCTEQKMLCSRTGHANTGTATRDYSGQVNQAQAKGCRSPS